MVRACLLLMLVLPVVLLTGRGVAADADDPPGTNQPLDFERTGGAVGPSFKVSMRVRPGEVQAGNAVTLTFRIQGNGAIKRVPKRPRLWELKPYKNLEKKEVLKFDRPDPKKIDRPDRTPDKQVWEFDYQVKLLDESLKQLPGVAFHYYRPPASAVVPGQYLTIYPEEVGVKVRPKPAALPPPPAPIKQPEIIFQLAEGPAVLQQRAGARFPLGPQVLLWILVPPVLAGCWYVLWRRVYPDAAAKRRIRQSLAARQALQALQALGTANPDQRAYRVARIAAGYLQQRLGLPTAEPTPAEVAACLERAGSPAPTPGKAAEFFRTCDAIRFGPPAPSADMAAAATQLIQSLETEPWATRDQ